MNNKQFHRTEQCIGIKDVDRRRFLGGVSHWVQAWLLAWEYRLWRSQLIGQQTC